MSRRRKKRLPKAIRQQIQSRTRQLKRECWEHYWAQSNDLSVAIQASAKAATCVKPVVEIKILKAENEFFKDQQATYRQIGPLLWTCVAASDGMKWLVGKTNDFAKLELIRRGFTWKWI